MATEYHVNGESGRSVRPGLCRIPGQSVCGILLPLAFVMLYFKLAILTPDAQSYYAQARLIAQGSGTGVDPESPLQYVGPHWNETAGGRYYCTHPPGLPVLLGGAYRVFGADAALLVSPLLASLTLLGLYLLGRSWAGAGWGMCAAALMAVNPVANEHALFGDSHCAVAFLLIWAVVFLDRWSKRSSVRWALAAGLFLGLIPTVRYAEATYLAGAALVVPTTVLYMSWYRPADGQSMRFLLPTFFVYAMGAIWLLRELGVRRPLAARVGAVILLAIIVAWGLPQSHLRLGQLRNQSGTRRSGSATSNPE